MMEFQIRKIVLSILSILKRDDELKRGMVEMFTSDMKVHKTVGCGKIEFKCTSDDVEFLDIVINKSDIEELMGG